jgi:hypothetical protein
LRRPVPNASPVAGSFLDAIIFQLIPDSRDGLVDNLLLNTGPVATMFNWPLLPIGAVEDFELDVGVDCRDRA